MIELNNLTTVEVDENFLKKIAEHVLVEEKKQDENVSIALIGQGRMRQLNKKYRGKNRVTDILSFREASIGKEKFATPVKHTPGLGEIVICLREVKKNAVKNRATFKKELSFCLIHGILHLLGYTHEKNEGDVKTMNAKQEFYLKQVFKSKNFNSKLKCQMSKPHLKT